MVPGRVEVWLLEALEGELARAVGGVPGVGDAARRWTAGWRFGMSWRGWRSRHRWRRTARWLLHRRGAGGARGSAGGSSPDLARLAHHAEAVGDAEAVLRWAPRAAVRAAAVGAHREAPTSTRGRFGSRRACPARHARSCWSVKPNECFLTNGFDQAIDALERAATLRRELGDQRRAGRPAVLAGAGRCTRSGRTPEAEAVAREAVALLEPLGRTRELARAYAARCHLCMIVADLEGAVAGARRDRSGRASRRYRDARARPQLRRHGDAPRGVPDGEQKLAAESASGAAGRARRGRRASVQQPCGCGPLASRAYGLAERYRRGRDRVLRGARTGPVACTCCWQTE